MSFVGLGMEESDIDGGYFRGGVCGGGCGRGCGCGGGCGGCGGSVDGLMGEKGIELVCCYKEVNKGFCVNYNRWDVRVKKIVCGGFVG